MKLVKVGVLKITGHKLPCPRIPQTTAAKQALADKMRHSPTKSEAKLVRMLADGGYRFKPQHLMFGYIADVFFPGRFWIVELDGRWHSTPKDKERDAAFLSKGIRTLRIASSRMFTEPAFVLREIEQTVRPLSVKKTKAAKKRKRQRSATSGLYRDPTYQDFLRATSGL